MKPFPWRWLILGLGVAAVAPAPGRAVEEAAAVLVLVGDQHSAYERTAQFVALVDRLRAEAPARPLAVLLDGDTMEHGNAVARRSGGAVEFAMFAALARRAPTILNLGNHDPEFHDVAETVRRVETTGVRVISNLVSRATGRPFAPAVTRLRLGDAEAVVVGVTTDALATYRVAVRPELDLADPVVWARRHFPELLGAAELPVVMSHAGVAADRQMLELVPAGTLFAGAHDHLRFVAPRGRGAYVHSGAWNTFVSLAWLRRGPEGAWRWTVEQVPVAADGPADPELVAVIRETRARWELPEDRAVVARGARELDVAGAARLAARALRQAAGAAAGFIGNTTFGAGLPAGAITRAAFDACVRFDGAGFMAEVGGARLRELLAAANQGPETPWAERRGEFLFADGPAAIEPGRSYRIATTDWGARHSRAYFGEPEIVWSEAPGVRLKAAVVAALAAP